MMPKIVWVSVILVAMELNDQRATPMIGIEKPQDKTTHGGWLI